MRLATTGKQHLLKTNNLFKADSKTKQVDMNKKENVLAHIIMKTALQTKYKTMIIEILVLLIALTPIPPFRPIT